MAILKRPIVLVWIVVAVMLAGHAAIPRLADVLEAFSGPFKLGPDFAGFWCGHFGGAAWTAVFWLAAFFCGRSFLSLMGRPRKDGMAGGMAGVLFVGFGMYAGISLANGLLGLLFPSVTRVSVIALGALGVRLASRSWRKSLPRESDRWEMIFRWLAISLGLVLALFSLRPETWDDSLGYHLSAPADFNKLHKVADYHRDMYRQPLLAEGLFGQGLLAWGGPAAAMINLTGGILVPWLLKSFVTRLAGGAMGWLAVLAYLASEQVGFHMGRTNQGFYSMGFAFLGVWIWSLNASALARSRAVSAVAGACLGWALCSKLTAAAPLLGIFAWHAAALRNGVRREANAMAWLAVGAILASAPFLAKGWLFTGNPVYPFVWGGLDWGEPNNRMLFSFGCPGFDFNLADPASWLGVLDRLLTVQQPVALLLFPVLAMLRFPGRGPFLAAWGGAVLAWAVLIPCLRMMMPVYPALAALCAIGLGRWLESRREMRGPVLAFAALIAMMGAIHALAGADFSRRSFNAALGLENGGEYCRRVLTTYWRAAGEVNRRGPASGRMLTVGERRGYLFSPLVYTRDIEDTPALLGETRESATPERERVRLRQMGVNSILLNYVNSEYTAAWRSGVFEWRQAELRRHAEFCRRYLEAVWTERDPDGINGGYVLYRIRARPGAGSARMPFLPGAEYAAVRESGETAGHYCRRLDGLESAAPGVVFFGARHAMALLKAGRPREALERAGAGLGSGYPEQAVLRGLRAEAYRMMGKFREALGELRLAEELKPGEPALAELRARIEREARGVPRHD